MTKVERVMAKLEAAERLVEELTTEYLILKSEAVARVKMTKDGETTTLTFKGRVFKVKRNRRYTACLDVFEGGRKIVSESMSGIHDLRFAIALGSI